MQQKKDEQGRRKSEPVIRSIVTWRRRRRQKGIRQLVWVKVRDLQRIEGFSEGEGFGEVTQQH